MTRMYLSPTATVFAKIGLLFIELIIGIFNLAVFPIRKIGLKAYALIMLVSGAGYAVQFHNNLTAHLAVLLIGFVLLAAFILAVKGLHKLINNKISPKVAMMVNAPLGIRRNKYYAPVNL